MTAFEFTRLINVENGFLCDFLALRFLSLMLLVFILVLILVARLILIVVLLVFVELIVVKVNAKNVLTLLQCRIGENGLSLFLLLRYGIAIIVDDKVVSVRLVAELFVKVLLLLSTLAALFTTFFILNREMQ